jgi:hypothetical protein
MEGDHGSRRFDPKFCGKVIRIVAGINLIVCLVTLALANLWIPPNSLCLAWKSNSGGPPPIYALIVPHIGLTIWTYILAVFWERFTGLVFSQSRWEGRMRNSTGGMASLFRRLLAPQRQMSVTMLLTTVFLGFAVFVSIPLLTLVQNCAS